MSSPNKQATRARNSLPAGLIFTPRELKQYRRWQSIYTTLKPAEYGFIPTAIEYDDFQQWAKKQDSGYFSDVFDDIYEHIKSSTSPSEPAVASICRHTIHPVQTTQPHLRCPVCTIDVHINYMKLLTRTLHGANGRPLPFTGTPSEQQEKLYLAWSRGKLSTLQQVCELEELSDKEAEWAKAHENTPPEDVQSASKALELYWFETAECSSATPCSTKKKSITFAADTDFLPGRPADYFLKRSPRYEPGKYTVVNEEPEDADVSEDSEDYSSARVFVLGGPEEHDTSEVLEGAAQYDDPLEKLEDDDGDSDWEDIDSDEEGDEDEDSSIGSYVCFEEDEESSFIVFSDD